MLKTFIPASAPGKLLGSALLAAAVTLPAAGALTATAALTAGAAHAQNPQYSQAHRHADPRIDRHNLRRNFTLRRCTKPSRWLYVNAMRMLLNRGYRNIRYSGYKQVRCHQVFAFRACRGHRMVRVSVRYSYGRYAGMIRRFAGFCRFYRGGPRHYRYGS